MRYYKESSNGYILSVGIGNGFDRITEAEYNTILSIIRNKPKGTKTTDYHLREDLVWESYELEPSEPQEITNEDKAEAYDILIGNK